MALLCVYWFSLYVLLKSKAPFGPVCSTCPRRDAVPRRNRRHAADDAGQDPARSTDQSYHRVGGQRPVKVDVRVFRRPRATFRTRSPPAVSARSVLPAERRCRCACRPLRERREDIPELVNHFLARFAAERRMPTPRISEEAMAALQAHDWPGNVRQLRNIIERTLILAPGDRWPASTSTCSRRRCSTIKARWAVGDRMAIMGSPLREAREILRARVSRRSRSAAFRQHLAHRVVHRHGTLRSAPQTEGARDRGQEGGGRVGAAVWRLDR